MSRRYTGYGVTIEVTETRGSRIEYRDGSGQYRGYMEYTVGGGTLEIHTMSAQPNRRRLGALLMYEAAVIAPRYGATQLSALNTALDAQGFYERMGFAPNQAMVQQVQQAAKDPEERDLLLQRIGIWDADRNVVQQRAGAYILGRWI